MFLTCVLWWRSWTLSYCSGPSWLREWHLPRKTLTKQTEHTIQQKIFRIISLENLTMILTRNVSKEKRHSGCWLAYRGNRLEVSSWGRYCCCCGGCSRRGARCIGHPGREMNGPALEALCSHLHKGTTVGRAQRAVHWAWRGVWGTSFLLLPLRGVTSTHVIPGQCTAAAVHVTAWPTADPQRYCTCWSQMHWTAKWRKAPLRGFLHSLIEEPASDTFLPQEGTVLQQV